jgi:integrase
LLEKPRKAQTLKTYVVSFKLFLNFLLSREEGIKRIDSTVTSRQMELIQAAVRRIEHWTGSLTPALTRRRAEVRKRDQDRLLGPEDFARMLASPMSQSIRQRFSEIDEDEDEPTSLSDFAQMRDYLMLRLLVASGQRAGALANLTVAEFKAGKQTRDLYVTQTTQHKTGSSVGPAKLFWDEELKKMGQKYLNELRPQYANSESLTEGKPGIPPEPVFFVNASGQRLTESRVSQRMKVMGKRMGVDVHGAGLRKSLISKQRRMGHSSAVSDEQLAKQMSHSVTTSDKYYNVAATGEEDLVVAKFLKDITTGKEVSYYPDINKFKLPLFINLFLFIYLTSNSKSESFRPEKRPPGRNRHEKER